MKINNAGKALSQNLSYQQKGKSLPSHPFYNHFFLLTMLIKTWNYWYIEMREILGLCLSHCCLLQTRKLRLGEGKWPLRVFHPGSGPADRVPYSTTADHTAHPTAALAAGHNPFHACFSLDIFGRVTLCFYKHITHSLLK